MSPSVPSRLRDTLINEIPRLRTFAASLCHNRAEADDLVQETLVKAWNKFDSFAPGTSLTAWLFTILRNTFLSERRKRQREVEDGDGRIAASATSQPEQPGHMELQDLRGALAALSEEQRIALILVAASGLSYEEAAEVCDCAVGTVKSRVNRARVRLAELLDTGPEAPPQAEPSQQIPAGKKHRTVVQQKGR